MSQIFLFFIARDEIVTVCPAVGERLLTMQHAVLERDHDLVKLAEQRHQLGNAELFCVRADGAARDAVIARALVG